MNRGSVVVSAEIAAAIMRGPVGAKQICLAIGLPAHRSHNLAKHIKAFRSAGLVYVHSYSNMRRVLYAWQPSPFFLPDAVVPPRKHKPRSEYVPRVPAEPPTPRTPPNSVFALGAL